MRSSLTEAPSLHPHYPASSVVRASPPPHTGRPVSRELPVDRYHDHRWGFPCCLWSPMRTCHRHYPGRSNGACSLVCLHCQRPSPCNSKVGSCNCFFEACSAFTHVTACTLAESPCDPLHRKLRQVCYLRRRQRAHPWNHRQGSARSLVCSCQTTRHIPILHEEVH